MSDMKTNKSIEQDNLVQSLKFWWKTNKGQSNLWNRNKVGKAIREMLTETNNFKYAPRGKVKHQIAAPNNNLDDGDSLDLLW